MCSYAQIHAHTIYNVKRPYIWESTIRTEYMEAGAGGLEGEKKGRNSCNFILIWKLIINNGKK